jgi:hypothetical protein
MKVDLKLTKNVNLDTKLCEQVVASGWLFSPFTDRHNIMEKFKVAVNTITLISPHQTTNCL